MICVVYFKFYSKKNYRGHKWSLCLLFFCFFFVFILNNYYTSVCTYIKSEPLLLFLSMCFSVSRVSSGCWIAVKWPTTAESWSRPLCPPLPPLQLHLIHLSNSSCLCACLPLCWRIIGKTFTTAASPDLSAGNSFTYPSPPPPQPPTPSINPPLSLSLPTSISFTFTILKCIKLSPTPHSDTTFVFILQVQFKLHWSTARSSFCILSVLHDQRMCLPRWRC